MGSWKKTRIEEFLFEREGKYKPDDKGILGLKKIEKITFTDGEIHLGIYKITKTKQIIVEPGDFVFSGLNIEKGAVSINKTKERLVVSANYSTCKVDYSVINQEFFLWYLRSPKFKQFLIDNLKKDYGFTRPKHLLPLEIELPDIEEQKQTVEHFKSIETEDTELKQELTHQQTLLKKLRQQILQEAIEGKLTVDWRQKQKLSPCQGGVPQSGEGVRGEGVERIQKEVKKLNNLPYLKTFRKTLRKNLTPAEAKFWTLLKNKQLDGRRFRRQYSVANYILDFFCPAEKLAIELDGEVHSSTKAVKYDRERDIFLAHTGIKVLRFENQFVFHDPDGLLARIKQEFNPSASARHLPLAGEEFESASELLKRIQTEKEQLIKDKKIRKQKPLPPISEEEKPFELPDGWVWCRLGDISINSLGKMLDAQKNKGELKPYLRNLNVQWFKVDTSDLKMMPFKNHETQKYSVVKGDIIICEGGYPGQAAIWDRNELIMFQKALHRVRFISECYPSSLFVHILWLWDVNGEIRNYYTGAGIQHLTGKSLNRMSIPLPPLPEQQAIVAKVEKLLALCDQLEAHVTQNQAHAEQLMQAVLKEAFTYIEPRKTLI